MHNITRHSTNTLIHERKKGGVPSGDRRGRTSTSVQCKLLEMKGFLETTTLSFALDNQDVREESPLLLTVTTLGSGERGGEREGQCMIIVDKGGPCSNPLPLCAS